MGASSGKRRAVLLLATLIAVFLGVDAASAYAECRDAKFGVGRIDTDTSTSLLMAIYLRNEDIAPGPLMCIATSIRNRYSGGLENPLLAVSTPSTIVASRG